MATPSERKFITFQRGEIRDTILRTFRNQLRSKIDPDTGTLFTEDKIAQITQPGSRFYMEADSDDLATQAQQASGLFLAGQLRPSWANTSFLENVWGPLWLGDDGRLSATGGSGTVTATATTGTIYTGSTTIPDAAATTATDVNGNTYQVLYTVTTPSSGTVSVTLKAVDTGVDTNPVNGSKLTWSANVPLGSDPECTVSSTPSFTGGFDEETDAEMGKRIEDQMRHRPGSGNNSQISAWGRGSSVAVEQAWVYACAANAGSTLVAITQKRNASADPPEGPNIRANPSEGTMLSATQRLTPPGSPDVPERAYVVVTSPNPQESNLAIRLSMSVGAVAGWADVDPWPTYSTLYPEVIVTSITSTVEFDVETDSLLPGGVGTLTGDDAPQLMLWNEEQSRYVQLDVLSVSKSSTTITIVLNAAPSGYTIQTGDRLSPYSAQRLVIAEACEEYFDELGPGEIVESTDPRAARALRFPRSIEQSPTRAGEVVLSRVIDALSGVASDASLPLMSRNSPDVPTDVISGPNMVTLGNLSIFPL